MEACIYNVNMLSCYRFLEMENCRFGNGSNWVRLHAGLGWAKPESTLYEIYNEKELLLQL